MALARRLKPHPKWADTYMMRRLLPLALCLAFLTGAGNADAVLARHTKVRAERNIISAQRMLARWRVGFVNPRTGLVWNNVSVHCLGRGAVMDGRYTHFACAIDYKRTRVSLTYLALPDNGFEVRGRRKTAR